jgi:hypothetical protein
MPESAAGPDVLADLLFTVAPGGERLPLPGLLARLLAGGEVEAFPRVTPEQQGQWWRFLVRCAAKALREIGASVASAQRQQPGELEERIGDLLRSLAPDGAWALYQPDPARPGFLQTPTPDGKSPGKGNNYGERSVSLLTSAIGSKQHERKSDVARELTVEEVVYALVEYQLSAIFGGRGNYESQLMGSRSGAGSGTPFMGARIGDSNGQTFRHDVQVLLDRWPETAHELAGGVWALWAESWDGKGQLASERLDPAFIPLARMVRLDPPADGLFRTLQFRPTDTGRVRDHTNGGRLGDLFTPLVPDPKTGELKVRGTLGTGYPYAEVVRLLGGDSTREGHPSPSVRALAVTGDDARADLRVVFEGTAYEQGKTGGFHRREVLLPPNGADILADPAPLRVAHAQMMQHVADTKKALRGAARIVLSGSPRPREGDATKIDAPAALLDQRVDTAYLEHLWRAAAAVARDDAEWIHSWTEWLSDQALDVFRASLAMLPSSTGRRLEREVSAEAYLRGKLAKLRGKAGSDETLDDDPEPAELEEQPA